MCQSTNYPFHSFEDELKRMPIILQTGHRYVIFIRERAVPSLSITVQLSNRAEATELSVSMRKLSQWHTGDVIPTKVSFRLHRKIIKNLKNIKIFFTG